MVGTPAYAGGVVGNQESERRGHWPFHRRVAAVLLVLVVIAAALLVFLPIGWQINRFIVALYYFLAGNFGFTWISIDGWAVVLNVALFAVPAFLAAIVWPRVKAWAWVVLWVAATIAIEAIQYVYLPRNASLVDVAANSIGGVIGVVLARALNSRAADYDPSSPV